MIEIEKDDLFSDCLWWFDLYGINPAVEYLPRWRKILRISIILSLSCSSFMVLMALVMDSSLETMVDVCEVFFPFIQATAKILVIIKHKETAFKILQTLNTLNSHKIKNLNDFKDIYKMVKKFLKTLRYSSNSAVVLMIVRAIYLGDKELPYIMWTPYNDSHYIIYLLVQSVNGFILILAVGAFDSFYASVITHVVAQIGILNGHMEDIFKTPGARFKKLLLRHNLILNCITNTEKMFSQFMLLQLLSNTCNICMGLFIININGFTHISAPIHFIMVGSSLMQLFLFCFFGYQIAIKLEETSTALYRSNWYEHLNCHGKDINFMQLRVNKINRMTIGGVLNLDLDTFTEVVKKSFSFYALLQAQRKDLE